MKKIDLITGFLGAGKTTFIRRYAQYLMNKGAKSVRTCTLLDKPCRRVVEFEADYVGKVIPDGFVVGYGLDYDEKYRSLPYVGILKPSAYEN